MQDFSTNPGAMFVGFWRYRELIFASVKREVLGRYRGSFFGLVWSFLNPLFMLAVYTFVFSEVFKARWGSGSSNKVEFALVLFAGLIVFNLFSECVVRAPNLVISNVNYVKKVVYPLEILVWVTVLSALFHAVVSLLVWFGAYAFFMGIPQVTALYLPLILLPFIFLILGVSWFLASIGVFLRDVAQFIGLATTALMFLSPIFYPIAALPADYQYLLKFNPLTPVVEETRKMLYWGMLPDPAITASCWAVGLAVAWLGFAWFQKIRKGFADVL